MNTAFNNGVFFYGEEATIFAADRKIVIMPNGKDQVQEVLEIPTQGMQENHVGGFLKAVRDKNKALIECTVEDAFKSTATVQLAMISYYTDSVVRWDMAKKAITDNSEASALLARPYRANYQRPV